MVGKTMTGKEVMHEHDLEPFELRQALLCGELKPFDPETGKTWCVLLAPCVVCDGDPSQHYPYCQCMLPERIGAKDCNRPDTMTQRLESARFWRKDVDVYAKAKRLPSRSATDALHKFHARIMERIDKQDRVRSAQDQQAEGAPCFATELELVQYHRGRGVHELHELARLVDDYFTGTARKTNEALGRLLPANPGAEISDESHKRQGLRLRQAYQKDFD